MLLLPLKFYEFTLFVFSSLSDFAVSSVSDFSDRIRDVLPLASGNAFFFVGRRSERRTGLCAHPLLFGDRGTAGMCRVDRRMDQQPSEFSGREMDRKKVGPYHRRDDNSRRPDNCSFLLDQRQFAGQQFQPDVFVDVRGRNPCDPFFYFNIHDRLHLCIEL